MSFTLRLSSLKNDQMLYWKCTAILLLRSLIISLTDLTKKHNVLCLRKMLTASLLETTTTVSIIGFDTQTCDLQAIFGMSRRMFLVIKTGVLQIIEALESWKVNILEKPYVIYVSISYQKKYNDGSPEAFPLTSESDIQFTSRISFTEME